MDNELIEKAIQIAKSNRDNFCLSLLQKNLMVGYIMCAKLIDILESKGIVSTYNSKENRRKVLI